jgi:methylmalonyl-CoA decarboxylase
VIAAAEVLTTASEQILDDATAALERRAAPHDLRGDVRPKLAELLRQLIDSVSGHDTQGLRDYCAQIAEERQRAGLSIVELQAAFNVLTEAVWAQLFNTLTGEDRIRAVELVSATLGEGRDAMVQAFVDLATRQSFAPVDGGTSFVETEIRGSVGILTMNDPARRNALGIRMTQGIIRGLQYLRDVSVRVVVLRAAPDMRVWSSGHDVHELPRGRRDPLAYDDPLEQCLRAVRSEPMPVIAMVHGSVWGGAFDLALSCDIIIADETATFAITPANLGLPYNTTGLLHFIGRVPLNVVKEMFFSAAPISAEQAEHWLIVNHLVPSDELQDRTFALADTMASKAPLAIAVVKEQLRVLSDYQPVAAQVYERIQGLRRQAYDSRDYAEGLAAFEDKRPPNFRGH